MAKAIARIFKGDTDQPVGVGFWVFPGCLLTCAHVVNQALGLDQKSQAQPDGILRVDFPFSGDAHRFEGRVVRWYPVERGQSGRDIAILELSELPPNGVAPMPLIEPTGSSLVTKGYPSGYDQLELSTDLTIAPGGPASDGSFQLENPTKRIAPGFSGAPVWEEASEGAVGMIVMSHTEKAVAWMIPSRVLRSVLGLPEMVGRSGNTSDNVRLTRTQKFVQGQIVLLESKLEAVEADLKTVQTSEGRQAFYERARQLIQEIERLEQTL
jgi:Trypsin-like peptidase domain